ncbi:MAG: hypothetical protein AB2811_02375, partial [Candidatus Sedimenticola endophacoides]
MPLTAVAPQGQQQRQHHRPAGRVVAQVTPGTQGGHPLQVVDDLGGGADKVAETGVTGADQPPQQAEYQQAA